MALADVTLSQKKLSLRMQIDRSHHRYVGADQTRLVRLAVERYDDQLMDHVVATRVLGCHVHAVANQDAQYFQSAGEQCDR